MKHPPTISSYKSPTNRLSINGFQLLSIKQLFCLVFKHNAPCWDWWETLRWDGQIGAGGMRVGAMMNGCGLVDGLGWGWEWGVWCWDNVGRAVDVPTQRYSTYPHPVTKSFPRIPIAYAPLATPHSHHLARTPTHNTYPTFSPPNSTPAPTLLTIKNY